MKTIFDIAEDIKFGRFNVHFEADMVQIKLASEIEKEMRNGSQVCLVPD